jgi:hypothetical protein
VTDQERDDLLVRLERKVDEHGGALKGMRAELNAIRVVLTGDRAKYYEISERVEALERKAG